MGEVGSENLTYDALLVLEDGDAAVTSTGVGQNGGANAELEVGSGQLRNAQWIVDVVDSDDADADETYVLELEGSNDGFSGTVVLATLTVTRGDALRREVIPFDNVVDGVIYSQIRVAHTLGGTTPSLEYKSRLGIK